MGSIVLQRKDVSYLDRVLKDENGNLIVLPSNLFKLIPQNDLSLWCLENAVYGLASTELIEWLQLEIDGRKAIEIGSGNGVFGRELRITATDSFLQSDPAIQLLYSLLRQPVIKYGKNVEKFDAKTAVDVYNPEVVIGSWVTQLWRSKADIDGNMHGIDEEYILSKVKTYIVVGHVNVHSNKRILSLPHKELYFDWLYSRSEKSGNRIYVWER